MLKRIDFVKRRRDEGRSLNKTVREVVALTRQHGIDLRAILAEASAKQSEEERRLTECLQESVLPLFVNLAGQPDRIGSCVLVRMESQFYAFTAAHAIQDAGSATLYAPSEGKGGKLRPLPPYRAHLKFSAGRNDLDMGVLALSAGQLGAFEHRNFLGAGEVDLDDRPDDRSLESFYLVPGYSASKTQLHVSKAQRHIYQQSFRCSTNPVEAAEYRQEQNVTSRSHLARL
ncbi:MAG TPA: hypothetical protein VJT08_21125 [Terriglobales bacterium]|nr:hypothetical protein [Terriglobales bacterium]